MSRPRTALRPSRLLVAAAAVAVLVLTAFTVGSGGADAAATASRHHPVPAGRGYLALGDSVTFGYREAANLPTPNYPDATSFVGYPEDISSVLGLHLANASCPGETSGSFVAAGAPSNGCESQPGGGPGYRTLFPLHARYRGTQLAYAVDYLRHHRGTRLVSLMIGANDGFLCQETTADQCASELPSVLARIRANVRTILSRIRTGAHYRGQIVIVTYYSLDYGNPVDNASSQALNAAMLRAAKPFHVTVADGYGTFRKAAQQAGGDSCKAGLLTQLTTGGCGVHPSVGGQSLLALAVLQAIRHRH